ncbi:glycosyltransferase [Flavobacterium sp. HNIBRBA15423]|uniref:glycosyltransferase n=1 Tax=Flavobacterium sp. HNIBRBA15423 TaxID=3458683 RepID=UPI00404438B4
MRIGMNPQKQSKKIDLKYQHRLIIVVFIPNLEGYYQNVFEVFKLCLESAITTVNDKCAITIVNNASCEETTNYLNESFKKGKINTLIHHKENIGKMDALIGAAKGSREPLITLSDVDILFKYGWQNEIENIFASMKNVGSVSPIPVRKSMRYGTTSTLQNIFTGKVKLTFESIKANFDDHNKYLKSINWEIENEENLKWPIISQNGVKAILGSGHQIMTLNRLIFHNTVPIEPSLTLVGNNSEFLYCDEPVDISGGMRLATYNNFAFHMGNKVENWMIGIQEENIKKRENNKFKSVDISKLIFKPKRQSKKQFLLKQRIIIKFFNLFYSHKIN